jgi:hypothetical protein
MAYGVLDSRVVVELKTRICRLKHPRICVTGSPRAGEAFYAGFYLTPL